MEINNRYTIINNLKKEGNIGIELGVAEGNYSIKMMESKKFNFFYGIDSNENFLDENKKFIKTKKKL
mgnify:CR=1 FL=1